ncbi:MAG: pilus assembly protein PilM [Nitrospinota bacterium]
MFLSRKTPLVAVDMGSHSIKMVQLAELKDGSFELMNLGVMPLEEGSIVEGSIKNPGQVSEALSSLIKAEKINSNYVVASVSGEAVFIKKIKIAAMTEEELSEKITEEAEQYIPFDINDVALDLQILGPANGSEIESVEEEKEDADDKTEEEEKKSADEEEGAEEEMVKALLVAVQREVIDERTDVLLEAGLKPAIIDLDVFALMNAARLNKDITAMGSIALIDLGDSFTHINILQNGSIGYTRDIPIGGGYCSSMLMSKFQVPFNQTHRMKGGYLPDGVEREEVLALIVQGYKKVLEEIQKSFEYFSTISNSRVERILLSGGGCLINGIDGFMADYLKVPVENLDPMQAVKINPKNFDREMISGLAGLSTVAMGLATRRFDY